MKIVEKNKKKKASSLVPKGTKTPSDYKSRESEGKTSQADSKFQKELGKAKDTQRRS